MSSLMSLEAWRTGLGASGYVRHKTADNGSELWVSPNGSQYRVSAFEPNRATACWMQRNNVTDARCLVGEGFVSNTIDLPEFGLEVLDEYHDDTSHITKTMLQKFSESPVEYHETYNLGTMEKKKPSKQMKMGIICHAMLLEQRRLDEACIAYPQSCYTDGGRLRTKDAEAFEASVAPLVAVRSEMIPVIERVIASAKQSQFGKLLAYHGENAKFETRVVAELWGLPCKCKPDLHIVLDDQIIVPDLKFGAFKPDDWRRSASRFGYALQQAHYTAILQQHYGRPVSWSFWAGETKPPYRFGPKDYDSRSIEMAADYHRRLVVALKRAYDTWVWEDDFEQTLTIAPWDLGPAGRVSQDDDDNEDDEENREYEHRVYESATDIPL